MPLCFFGRLSSQPVRRGTNDAISPWMASHQEWICSEFSARRYSSPSPAASRSSLYAASAVSARSSMLSPGASDGTSASGFTSGFASSAVEAVEAPLFSAMAAGSTRLAEALRSVTWPTRVCMSSSV